MRNRLLWPLLAVLLTLIILGLLVVLVVASIVWVA